MKNIKIIFVLSLIFHLSSCEKNEIEDADTPEKIEVDDDVVIVDDTSKADVYLTVNADDGITINPEIFGVNNDWRQIPDNTFFNFSETLKTIENTLVRYPGGWESEYFDWASSTTPGWNNTPEKPGASVASLKSNISNYSIVIPTSDAMNTNLGSEAWDAAMLKLKNTAEKAIDKSGIKEGVVEIGNEWWLQYAGGASRAQKLEKYVNVAMDLAEHIDDKFQNREFKLLINGDYTKPEEFSTMKNKFTKAYQAIDGVALHTYTGYQSDTHNIKDLQSRIANCANNFNSNKKFIYLSEWMPSRDYNNKALYMEAANIIPDIMQIYARSGANAAAYWPPINSSIPGLGLTNWNYSLLYPTGQILAELSKSFKGKVLKTTSDKFHLAAALSNNQTMVLFLTGGKESYKTASIKVEGFNIQSIKSVQRFVPADYADTGKAAPYSTETSTASIKSNQEILIDVNKEGLYQIYKIVLEGN